MPIERLEPSLEDVQRAYPGCPEVVFQFETIPDAAEVLALARKVACPAEHLISRVKANTVQGDEPGFYAQLDTPDARRYIAAKLGMM